MIKNRPILLACFAVATISLTGCGSGGTQSASDTSAAGELQQQTEDSAVAADGAPVGDLPSNPQAVADDFLTSIANRDASRTCALTATEYGVWAPIVSQLFNAYDVSPTQPSCAEGFQALFDGSSISDDAGSGSAQFDHKNFRTSYFDVDLGGRSITLEIGSRTGSERISGIEWKR